nr:reverse transcriptase domain-containing protein [Tanacetum cinerariifolium]
MNGRGRPIALVNIQATDFGLKNHMIQQVQNSSKERYKLSIDRCLNHNMLPVTQIDTFYNGLTLRHRDTINVAAEGTFMKRRPEECYDLIENMTAHHNDWNTSTHRGESSSSTTSSSSEIAALAQQMEIPQGALPRKTVLDLREQINSITTRSGLTTVEPSIPPPVPPTPKEEVEQESKTSMDEVHITSPASTAHVPPLGIQPVVDKFNFLADFIVVDFEADLRVPIILGRPFLRTTKALVDLYKEKLTLTVRNEQVVFYTNKSSRNNLRDIQSVHCINVIDFSKDKLISGGTTFPYDSSPSLTPFETSDSLLEDFIDELDLFDPFSPGNEDNSFDPKADLREIEYLLNRDPSIDASPTTDIDIIDPILERFTDGPALVYSFSLGDDDDDLFDFKSDNKEWKKLLYGDHFNDIHFGKNKIKDSKIKILIDELESPELNVLLSQLLDSDSTLPEESSESSATTTLLSSPFGNEDKVFNPDILILGGTRIFNNELKDKDLKVNTSSEAFVVLEDSNFLPLSSDREFLFT